MNSLSDEAGCMARWGRADRYGVPPSVSAGHAAQKCELPTAHTMNASLPTITDEARCLDRK